MAKEIYVIILDSALNNPTHWEYVVERDTEAEIEQANTIENIEKVSKQDYDGVFIKKKTVYGSTGAPADGNIYKLTERQTQSVKKSPFLCLLILILLSACATSSVERRYASATFHQLSELDAEKYVTVTVNSYPAESKPHLHKSIFDLSDHGQQAYIASTTELTELTEKDKLEEKFISQLIQPLEKKEEDG